MDPQVVWDELVRARVDGDTERACDLAKTLKGWLGRDGFPPQTIPGFQLDVRWNRAVAIAACQAVTGQRHG